MPCGRTPAAAHSANSFTCVPDESPRETNRAPAWAMRANASAACPASAAHISAACSHRRVSMRRLALVLLAALIPAIVPAQGFQLTVENIMRGADLVGTAPANVRFSADGRYVYFRWRSPGADTADQDYRAAVAGWSPERIARCVYVTCPMADGTWSP